MLNVKAIGEQPVLELILNDAVGFANTVMVDVWVSEHPVAVIAVKLIV